MPEEVVNVGSPNPEATPVEGSAGTTAEGAGEQPKSDVGDVSIEQLKKERDNAVKSYNDYRSMSDRQRVDLEKKINALEQRINQPAPEPEPSPVDAEVGNQETINKLRQLAKEDPLTAMSLLIKADRMSRAKEVQAPDPTLAEVKNERLFNKTLTKMGVPDVPRDEIFGIMNELGMRPDSELAVKTAIEVYKGRNAGASAPTTTGGTTVTQSHDKPADAVRKESVVEYNPTDKVAISAAINRKVFNGVKDFEDFSKDLENLPKGEHGGFVISDRERVEEKK